MTTHIMLDIETWGTIPGSDLRSIGAVMFDPIADWVHGGLDDEFYVATKNPIIFQQPWFIGTSKIEPRSFKYPLKRDPATIEWWNKQSPAAHSAFNNPVELREALANFAKWFAGWDNGNYGSEKIRLWANDPHFDVEILAAAFRAVGLDVPWHYRAPRSQRTIVELAGMTRDDFTPFQVGETHNALDDARTQAAIVCDAYRRLGIER